MEDVGGVGYGDQVYISKCFLFQIGKEIKSEIYYEKVNTFWSVKTVLGNMNRKYEI